MAAATADLNPIYELGDVGDLPVKASQTIYRGEAVGLTSGYARQLNAGDTFVGFATAKAVGTSSDGGVNVNIIRNGFRVLTISGVAVTDVAKPVYASDSNTYVLTQSTNTRIGTVARYISSNTALVKFESTRSFGNVALTDNSGGTASTTIASITAGAAYSQADMTAVKNAIATLAARDNSRI